MLARKPVNVSFEQAAVVPVQRSPPCRVCATSAVSSKGRRCAHRYDLILDIAGNPALSRLRRALTSTGTAVITGSEEGGNVTGASTDSCEPWPCHGSSVSG